MKILNARPIDMHIEIRDQKADKKIKSQTIQSNIRSTAQRIDQNLGQQMKGYVNRSNDIELKIQC